MTPEEMIQHWIEGWADATIWSRWLLIVATKMTFPELELLHTKEREMAQKKSYSQPNSHAETAWDSRTELLERLGSEPFWHPSIPSNLQKQRANQFDLKVRSIYYPIVKEAFGDASLFTLDSIDHTELLHELDKHILSAHIEIDRGPMDDTRMKEKKKVVVDTVKEAEDSIARRFDNE